MITKLLRLVSLRNQRLSSSTISSYSNCSFYLLNRFNNVNNLNVNQLSKCLHSTVAPTNMAKVGARAVMSFNKQYLENENEIAFNIISPNFISNHNAININLPSETHYYNQFMHLIPGDLEDKQYAPVIDGLIDEVESLDFDQLASLLSFLSLWSLSDNVFTLQFRKLWSAVDDQLVRLLNESSFESNQDYDHVLNKALNIANIMYILKLSRICKFSRSLLEKLGKVPDLKMDKSQLLSLMFEINIQRAMISGFLPTIKSHLEKYIDSMSLDELSVISLALFKTQTRIPSHLVGNVTNRMTQESDKLTNFVIASLSKSIRFSVNRFYTDSVREFFIKIRSRLSQFSEPSQVHLVLLLLHYEIFDKQILDEAFTNMCNHIEAYRMKDIERIMLCMSMFGHKVSQDKLMKVSANLMKRTDERREHPSCFLSAAFHFVLLEYYDKQILTECFRPSFIQLLEKKTTTISDSFYVRLLTLNTALAIKNKKEYSSLLLPPDKVIRLHKRFSHDQLSQHHLQTRRSFYNSKVFNSLRTIYGDKLVMEHILPFSAYPFILILNNTSVKEKISLTNQEPGMFADCILLYILLQRDYLHQSSLVRGSVAIQIRLLTDLGFKVIPLPFYIVNQFSGLSSLRNHLLNLIGKTK